MMKRIDRVVLSPGTYKATWENGAVVIEEDDGLYTHGQYVKITVGEEGSQWTSVFDESPPAPSP